ncbi:related to disulfide isomerase [Ramularia collo-cygni]|uniref:Related to disulfide isomerase n=1 Tax=Ramularia collo-cygni TaxID=112498 RepID=A0A2D3URC7_9PEZI|nr:related to disulfide isomerase [Ramularia collo-cygni]CZT19662.1 related to disulfide isomerase [Ramularia collo-cygni]
MRLTSILSLALPILSLASDHHRLVKRDEIVSAGGKLDGDLSTTTDGGASEGTVFNGKRSGYWLVEFFSPYCHHCKQFAPTWQTNYEFYYTSEPVPQTTGSGESHDDMNSFTRFYDFKFAKVDCVANGDACNAKKIGSFPTVVLFKDGVEVDNVVGGVSMEALSQRVEKVLETIRPGSRPQDGLKLPKVGDKAVDITSPTLPPAATAPAAAPKTSKPKVSPNPDGKSVVLVPDTFESKVTRTRQPWFIKFYAPWCHHCQAMAPNWQGMARQMENKLNVGEVNCEAEKTLCKDMKIRSYPTILYFRGGERIEYDGLRGLGDLLSFANKAVAAAEGVVDVTASSFEALEKKEEVIFLYFYDQATTSEDFAALERLVLNLVGHAKLVKTKDPALSERFKISTWPRLLVSRDGKASYYNGLSPREMRDARRVLEWMQSVWLPIVPEVTAGNAREVMDGKLVVLAILNRERKEEFLSAKREIKNAALEWIDKQTQAFQLERQELRDAKQLRIEEAEDRNDQRALRAAKQIRINMDDIERREVGFAWVDGVFWERWVKTTFGISVLDGEKVVVNDERNHRYWDVTMTGNPIVPSRTSILETLPRIVANPPKIQPKRTTNALGHLWWVLKGLVVEHPVVSLAMALGMCGIAGWYGRRHVRNVVPGVGGGYIKLGEKGGMDGLLGGNSGGQGKVD